MIVRKPQLLMLSLAVTAVLTGCPQRQDTAAAPATTGTNRQRSGNGAPPTTAVMAAMATACGRDPGSTPRGRSTLAEQNLLGTAGRATLDAC